MDVRHIPIIVFVLMTMQGQSSSVGMSRQEVIELGKSYCPSIPFCTNNNTDGKPRTCCVPCSCDESCARTKSCCPDVYMTSSHTEVHTTCEDGFLQNEFYKTTRQEQKINPLPEMNYEMIARCSDGRICPSWETNEELPVEDLVAVEGERETTLFKNKICAECNGVYNYTRWELVVVQCTDNINSKKTWILKAYNRSKNCALLSYPSVGDIVRYSCNRNAEIKVCNKTKRWDVFDLELENACLDPFSVFPFHDTPNSMSYKNVFCFLCNNPNNITVDTRQCTGGVGSNRDIFGAFSDILRFNFDHVPASEVKKVVLEDKPCEDSEIFDTFHNVCRTFHCYDSLEPRHGRCVVAAMLELYKVYSVYIGLYPLSTEIIWDTGDYRNINISVENQDFLSVLSRKLSFSYCVMKVARESSLIYTDQEGGIQYINIHLAISKSTGCNYFGIVQDIAKFKLKREQITLFFNSTPVEFIIELSQVKKYETMLDLVKLSFVINGLLKKEGRRERVKPPFACPYVDLNENAYCQIVQNYHNVRGISMDVNTSCPVLFDTALDGSTYSLCIKTFIILIEPQYSGTVSPAMSYISLLGIVVPLYVLVYESW